MVIEIKRGVLSDGNRGVYLTQGGNIPQSLPICVVKIWREMGPFSVLIGTGGVCQYGCISHVILQYGYNIQYSDEATACTYHK